MMYIYLIGVVIAFVIFCSMSDHRWDKERYWTKNDQIISNMGKAIELLVLSSVWPVIFFLHLLATLAERIKKLNIRINTKENDS